MIKNTWISLCFLRRPQNLTTSSLLIWRYVVNVKLMVKILSIFMAFFENMNFKSWNSTIQILLVWRRREQSKAPPAVIYHGPLNHNGIRPTHEDYHTPFNAAQCPRVDLNIKSLPGPKTTTAWKLTPYRSKISKNWNPPHWVPLHRFFKNWFLLIQKQLYST